MSFCPQAFSSHRKHISHSEMISSYPRFLSCFLYLGVSHDCDNLCILHNDPSFMPSVWPSSSPHAFNRSVVDQRKTLALFPESKYARVIGLESDFVNFLQNKRGSAPFFECCLSLRCRALLAYLHFSQWVFGCSVVGTISRSVTWSLFGRWALSCFFMPGALLQVLGTIHHPQECLL